MKLTILLLAYACGVVASSGGCFAQTHHPLLRADASWDEAEYQSSTICGWISGTELFIQSDTMIGGTPYKQFGARPILDADGPPFCPPGYYVGEQIYPTNIYLWEDTVAGLVFQFDPDSAAELLVYDYNLQVGDTIDDYFDFELIGFPPTPTVVSSLDSVMLTNGGYHRRWNLFTDIWGGITHDFIEGVGSTFGLLHPSPQYVGDGSHLWCYKRNGVDVLWAVHYCPMQSTIGITDLTRSPAPSDRELILAPDGTWSVTGPLPVDLVIWAIDGRRLYSSTHSSSGQALTPQLSPGAYIYMLSDAGVRVGSGSFVLTE